MAEPLIAFDDVRAGYGSAVVLDGVTFALPEHGSLAVLGRNGVGKSTLMLTIMGYTQIARGRIAWRGEDITRRPPHRRALSGIGWVAQEREIFTTLTVEEISTSPPAPGAGISPPCTICFRGSPNGGATWATNYPAASSRCSPSHAH